MARYVTKIHSPRPAPDVFADLVDFTSTERWDPGVVAARRVSDDIGAPTVGTRFEVVVQAGFRRLPLTYEISALDEDAHSVTLDAETPMLRSHDVITVEPAGTGCVVTYDATLDLRGIARIAGPALDLAFGRIGDKAAAGLASYVDASGHQRVAA